MLRGVNKENAVCIQLAQTASTRLLCCPGRRGLRPAAQPACSCLAVGEVLGFMQALSEISPCPASQQALRKGARLVDAQTRSAWSMGAEPSGACARRPRAVGQLSCCSSRTTSR